MSRRKIRSRIQSVLFVPDPFFNMNPVLSVHLTGHSPIYSGNICRIEKNKTIFAEFYLWSLFFTVHNVLNLHIETVDITRDANMKIWHQRLVHVHVEGIRTMVKNDAISGIKVNNKEDQFNFTGLYTVRELQPVYRKI